MLKLLTLNLLHDAFRWEERLPLVVAEILRQRPHVAVFQEVALAIEQAQQIAEAVNQRAPELAYGVAVEPKWGTDSAKEGIGVLSCLPILEQERLELPLVERVAQRISIEVAGARVDIINTHLHHSPLTDETIRLPQMQALLDWMAQHNDRTYRWLLAGDMNAMPQSETILLAKARLKSAYEAVHGQEPETTWPTPFVQGADPAWRMAIDYIFFDPQTLAVREAVLAADAPHPEEHILYPSDHYGLAALVEVL